MTTPKITELVADYLRNLARTGLGFPTNNLSVSMRMGISPRRIRAAKMELIKSQRLIGSGQIWYSIDGLKFGVISPDEVEDVKQILRRHFKPVFDARTEAEPHGVPKGRPKMLVVGGKLMPWADAAELAGRLK